jgi:hypothetical protein
MGPWHLGDPRTGLHGIAGRRSQVGPVERMRHRADRATFYRTQRIGRQIDGIIVVVVRVIRDLDRIWARRPSSEPCAVRITVTAMTMGRVRMATGSDVQMGSQVVVGRGSVRVRVGMGCRLGQQPAGQHHGQDASRHGFLIGTEATVSLILATRAATSDRPAYHP